MDNVKDEPMDGPHSPDDAYFTLSTVPINTTLMESVVVDEQSKFTRHKILPCFPPNSTSKLQAEQPRPIASTVTTVSSYPGEEKEEEIHFLLCNIPEELLTYEQYQRRKIYQYTPAFQLHTLNTFLEKSNQSYLLSIFHDVYLKLSQEWHIDIPILDHNLARLRQLATKYGFYFTDPDLPIALEFYLQMDIDVFDLKTCSFRQSKPYGTGIFTGAQYSIKGRYDFVPCHGNNCFCCAHDPLELSSIQFSTNQIHTFCNQYRAILNCPVTCTSSNIIYALTCPCDKKEYVAYTNLSLVDCIIQHRREMTRIILEFLLGEPNVSLMGVRGKPNELKMNDQNWLYRHAARCPIVIQAFLDRNPLYWCFVPVPRDEALRASVYTPSSLLPSNARQISTTERTMSIVRRSDAEAIRLAQNIPQPKDKHYFFTSEQTLEQATYFKYGKECIPLNVHKANFYNATIVAALPDHCSDTVKKFIESLFITHAECQLNKDGHLVDKQFRQTYSSRGSWYRGLVRRPSPSIIL